MKKVKEFLKIIGIAIAIIFGLSLIIGVIGAIIGPNEVTKAEPKIETSKIEVAKAKEVTKTEDLKPIAPEYNMADELKKDAQKRVDNLKSHFDYKYDEFREVGFYTHKNISAGILENKKGCLTCYCNNTGYVFVVSIYKGDDWIFHTHFFTLIDGNKMPSQVVPTNDSNNVEKATGDGVTEVITYDNEKTNFLLIANNVNSVIKVRLEGNADNEDFVLSKAEKQMFKETYELSNALHILNSK